MKLKTLIASTMLAGALIGCGGGSTGGNEGVEYTPYPDAPEITASEKQAFLDAVNEERESGRYCGDTWYPAVPALKWDDHLYAAAYEHARDISETRHYEADHSGSNTDYDWTAKVLDLGRGSTIKDRILNSRYADKYGSSGWNGGENMHLRDGSLDEIMSDFWASDEHCSNFMAGRYDDIGFAHYENEDGADGWVADMGGQW